MTQFNRKPSTPTPEVRNPAMSTRKPWLAALMSLVLPGFGQLHNGELNKALWLFLGFAFVTIPYGALLALYLPDSWLVAALVVCTLECLALWVYSVADAWSVAKRLGSTPAHPWQTSGMYLVTLVLCGAFALPMLYNYVRGHWVEPFRIPSSSMAPGIVQGDFLIADKRYNCPGCKHAVKRGDIAIFVYPNDRTLHYIKRIVGLPGDKVHLKGRELFLNGQSLKRAERGVSKESGLGGNSGTNGGTNNVIEITEQVEGREWQVFWAADEKGSGDFEVTVPPGHVLVLGDQRALSKDSRVFGTVPLQDVVGRARQLWFSYGEGKVRWERLGLMLK
jgi:signal peptidase I